MLAYIKIRIFGLFFVVESKVLIINYNNLLIPPVLGGINILFSLKIR